VRAAISPVFIKPVRVLLVHIAESIDRFHAAVAVKVGSSVR
jgi:hypothetical protein